MEKERLKIKKGELEIQLAEINEKLADSVRYIDENHVDGVRVYSTEEEAFRVIKEILADDEEMLESKGWNKDKLDEVHEMDLIELGFNHYGIYEIHEEEYQEILEQNKNKED